MSLAIAMARAKAPVETVLAAGRDVLFDIDWQGAQQLYQEAGPDVVRVFILPPSIEELERRLRARNTDSDAVIEDRMARAKSEIGHWDGYDYVLINDDVERCFAQVRQILTAERLKRRRQKGLDRFCAGSGCWVTQPRSNSRNRAAARNSASRSARFFSAQ
jgi:guanylate kinase